MIFSLTVCHRHTVIFCMTGRGDGVDGVVTCYRLNCRIWTPREEEIVSFSYLSVPALRPTEPCLVWYDALSWEYSSQGMELITHPSLVLMLRTSKAVPLLLWSATISMLLSDLYLLHTCGWLFMNSVFMYQQKRRAANNKSVKSKEFIKSLLLPSETGEVTWHTVAIIIWVVLLFLYLCICGVSLSSIRGWKSREGS